MATITFDIVFDLDNDTVILKDKTDYTGYTTDIHGIVYITGPNGAVNTPGTSSSPDITITSADFTPNGQASREFSIAYASSLPGTWSVGYEIYPNSGVGAKEMAITKGFTYNHITPTTALSMSVSTLASQVTSTDSTDYTNGGLATEISKTRTHSIHPPLGALDTSGNAIPDPADSGSAATITYTGITTGTWESQISTAIELELGSTIVDKYRILETITSTSSASVGSSAGGTVGLCDVYCCLKALNLRYEEAKCMNKSLAQDYKSKIEDVTRLVTLYNQSVDCGLTNDAEVYLTEIKNVSECSTECNCYGEDSIPANIPIASSTSSVSYELAAGSTNMKITSSGTGTSADPVVYNMDLGTVAAGNITYIAENLNSATTELAEAQTNMTSVENDISNLESGVKQQVYDISIDTSANTVAVTPLFTTSQLFNENTSAIFDNIGEGNFEDLNASFTVSDLYIVVGRDSFSVNPNSFEYHGLKVDIVSKSSSSTGNFVFRLLDAETNQPVTNRNLSNYASNINITFRIITK